MHNEELKKECEKYGFQFMGGGGNLNVAIVGTGAPVEKKLKTKHLKKPTQCHLWQKKVLTEDDFNMAANFDLVKELVDESHWIRHILRHKECGQLYFKELYEEIDWADGNDFQYRTYIPIEVKDIEEISKSGLFRIGTFYPQIRYDYPRSRKLSIEWLGRDATEIEKSKVSPQLTH